MVRSVQEIEQEVRLLRVAERNRLLRELIADIDGEPEEDVEQAWLQEAKSRHEELQHGSVAPVPAADVIRKARLWLPDEG